MLNKKQTTDKSFDQEIREIYQERNAKMFISKPSKSFSGLWIGHILWLIVAIVASITTTLIVVSWFSPLILNIPVSNERPVLVIPENSLAEVIDRLTPTSVVIFVQQNTTVEKAGWQQTYLITKALGHGVVLSSDGWIVSTTEVIDDLTKKYLVAVADGKMYEVESLVKDPAAALVYLKVTANNLTPVAFARFSEINLGDSVVALAATTQSLTRTALVSKIATYDNVGVIKNTSSLIKNSDAVNGVYILDNQLPDNFIGSPVALLNGKVVGLVASKEGAAQYVHPLEILDIVVDGLFFAKQVKRPVLGVNYITLDGVSGYSSTDLNLPKDGALLVANGNLPAIEANSPAAKAGLKPGDVITYLAGERINSERNLSDLLQQYRPGTKILLKVWRNGKESEIEVKLGETINLTPVEIKK